ncbi:hypothetical protein BQ8794_50246 [Mesorhizobium prunaredense]|uniref:NAD-dependent epimerase/dehydratase domain-containing protein n=1 Tax=Mesorhizobium prunaredense TaxID=1631249 RepID=A0A1R3VDZ0_9HYPH|nr:NAD(P)-dependent oxidoreductase [Mesorhizobium prunaredense]SIT58144.1 hypothetical protein BQ8794_50246 [Mesorhizobium prunaredense]
MTKRIVILGANGQVGNEVTLQLANQRAIEVVPVVRSPSGSAVLRYNGVAVLHGSIDDPAQARRLQQGADVVANFALPVGTPSAMIEESAAIIDNTIACSPPGAVVVFFSTLAVLGVQDTSGRKHRSLYGNVKLRNEQQILALAKKNGRRAYVLRLGHVAGVFQTITGGIRAEIAAGPVSFIEADRRSNLVYTATIADALCAIAEGRAGEPGLYDLVNEPQWTWREIYEFEAARIGSPLQEAAPISVTPMRQTSHLSVSGLRQAGVTAVQRLGLKQVAMRFASALPRSLNEKIQADYNMARARSEIAALAVAQPVLNPAQNWPGLQTRGLPGLRATRELLDSQVFEPSGHVDNRWPKNLHR